MATQPDLSAYEYPIHRQLMPDSRPKIIQELAEKNIVPTSMIDISDGLSSELEHLVVNSKIGYKIFEEKLPIDPTTISTSEELNLNATTVALNGGEDYELLFTVGLEHHQTIKQIEGVSIIGHTLEDQSQKLMVTQAGQEIEIKKDGWTVFKKED